MIPRHDSILGITHNIDMMWLASLVTAGLGKQIIRKMCFKYPRSRVAFKHFMHHVRCFLWVGALRERNNHSIYPWHLDIQSSIIDFAIVNYLPNYFLSPCRS